MNPIFRGAFHSRMSIALLAAIIAPAGGTTAQAQGDPRQIIRPLEAYQEYACKNPDSVARIHDLSRVSRDEEAALKYAQQRIALGDCRKIASGEIVYVDGSGPYHALNHLRYGSLFLCLRRKGEAECYFASYSVTTRDITF